MLVFSGVSSVMKFYQFLVGLLDLLFASGTKDVPTNTSANWAGSVNIDAKVHDGFGCGLKVFFLLTCYGYQAGWKEVTGTIIVPHTHRSAQHKWQCKCVDLGRNRWCGRWMRRWSDIADGYPDSRRQRCCLISRYTASLHSSA